MGKNMTVAFDLDNVFENLGQVWVEYLMQKYSVKPVCNEYNLLKSFPMLTREQIYQPLHSGVLYTMVEPIPGMQKLVKTLQKERTNVRICSSSECIPAASVFIRKAYPTLADKIHWMTDGKKDMDCDVLVDDYPVNFEFARFDGILFSSRWNRNYATDTFRFSGANRQQIIRAETPQEIYDLLVQWREHRMVAA